MIRNMHLPPSGVSPETPLELWGGVECTCNRVGDRFFDQMELSGHAWRTDDFARFSALGLTRLRCGLLWERYEASQSWDWTDGFISAAQTAGIRPIAGLVHHGSGPRPTNLLDPNFPEALAAYAGEVAKRYPWVDSYTPVNEPNTTARFSGLYGAWFPHHHTKRSYLRALLNQLKATVLSMEAIRRVRSDARLIQTDDCGNISGTEILRPTWELLNERQWLTFDLLCGRVHRHHPMFDLMRREGISDREILWFADHPCPPDVIGLNYYVTSDRYLDHRLDAYPDTLRSSEGPFVDLEAVRILPEGNCGFESVLREAWTRYSLPIALTEVHLGSDVEEQIRWLTSAWKAASRARHDGVNCTALTVWALLGSFFWDQLVTRDNGHYEPGAFDVSSGQPVQTQLAHLIEQLAQGKAPDHPALAGKGWWERDERLLFSCEDTEVQEIAA